MELNKIYFEPALETLSRMKDNSIDCVITSPPYWQLRDYGYEGQWGLEPTFQGYLDHLWSMMDEIYRVLKPEGTCWINLGDSYFGSGHGDWSKYDNGEISHKDKYYGDGRNSSPKTDWDYSKMKAKTLILIPHRFAIGCIDRGWIMRNDCIWAKRNGMPESVTDRFSKKHEYFFFMVKSEKYYFDLDAIRDKHAQVSIERWTRGVSENNKWVNGADGQTPHNLSQPRPNITTKIPKEQCEMFGSPRAREHREGVNPKRTYENGLNGYNQQLRGGENDKGKNPGSVSDFWDVPTKPSSEKHYASYNDSLLVKPVLAGCPKGGIIYDPFFGIGSTGEVALRSGRNFIGSEMSKEYVEIANKRLEPFLMQKTLF
jgi:DNA modification methylase